MFAGLVAAAPATAGELAPEGQPVPWQRLPADGGATSFSQNPPGIPGLRGLEFSPRDAWDGVARHGLFFRAGDGVRIGAQGEIGAGFDSLLAIFALRLDF